MATTVGLFKGLFIPAIIGKSKTERNADRETKEASRMDINHPLWETWEAQFMALAEHAEETGMTGAVKGAQQSLCLAGDNGYTPEAELAELATMALTPDRVKKVTVQTAFWEDIVLYVP